MANLVVVRKKSGEIRLCVNFKNLNKFSKKDNYPLPKMEHLVPPGFNSSQARTIKLKTAKYCIHENLLYWRDPSGVLLRCLDKEQSVEVMQQFHSSVCG